MSIKLTDFKIRMIATGAGHAAGRENTLMLYALLEDGRIFSKPGYAIMLQEHGWKEVNPVIEHMFNPPEETS